MRSGVGDRIFKITPGPTGRRAPFTGGDGRAAFLQECRPTLEMLALLTIGVQVKVRVRAWAKGGLRCCF
jgi:hypothetical protein